VLNANERPSDPAARRLSWAAVQADDALAESLRSGEGPAAGNDLSRLVLAWKREIEAEPFPKHHPVAANPRPHRHCRPQRYADEEPGHHRRPDAIAHHDCTDPAARRHPGGHPAARGNRTGRHRTEPLRTFRSAGAQEPMGSFPVTASA